jgi:5-formyltetrahydrofolate cyclo-ligase
MSPEEAKRLVRAEMRELLRGVSGATRAAASAQAVRVLREQAEWRRAGSVLGYCAIGHELDLGEALAASGKQVTLPRFDPGTGAYVAALAPARGAELRQAAYGIPEPPADAGVVALNQLDLVLVPGLAFDASGRRLGRGKGFYDRLLAEVNGIKCGVALDEQIVERLPEECHDVSMNFILTPTRWLIVPPAES